MGQVGNHPINSLLRELHFCQLTLVVLKVVLGQEVENVDTAPLGTLGQRVEQLVHQVVRKVDKFASKQQGSTDNRYLLLELDFRDSRHRI